MKKIKGKMLTVITANCVYFAYRVCNNKWSLESNYPYKFESSAKRAGDRELKRMGFEVDWEKW